MYVPMCDVCALSHCKCVLLLGAFFPLCLPAVITFSSLRDLEEVRTRFRQKMSWYQETVQCIEESKRLLKVSRVMHVSLLGLKQFARLHKLSAIET